MREILFRGKATNRKPNCAYRTKYKNGDWVYGLLTDTDNYLGFAEMTNTDGVCCIEVDKNTIGQYTGLTDKNGKKIFEGDILFVTVREYTKECGIRKFTGNTVKTVWSVEYAERRTQGNGFFVFGKDRRFSVGLTKSVIYNASPEIIGNIHDNPELLKGGGQE